MTSLLLRHGLLLAAGVTALAVLAAACARLWRRKPAACYRLFVTALVALLFLGPAQVLFSCLATDPVAPAPLSRPGDTVQEEEVCVVVLRGGPGGRAPDEPPPPTALRQGNPGFAGCPDPEADRGFPWVVALFAGLYLIGAVGVGGYHALCHARTRRFLRCCRPVVEPEPLAVWNQVAAASPVRDRVRLLACAALRSPCCGGLHRPYVVLPEADLDGPGADSLTWALRHELVHLERNDVGVALLKALVLVLFWFHPAAWWLARQQGWWCEASCDQWVVRRWGHARSYALALLHYAQRNRPRAAAAVAGTLQAVVGPSRAWRWPPWNGSASQLRRRVEALAHGLEPRSPVYRLGQEVVAAALVLLLCAGHLTLAATWAPRPTSRPPSAARPVWAAERGEEDSGLAGAGLHFLWYKDGRRIEIHTEGAVTYDAAGTGVAALAPGSSVHVVESQPSGRRRLEITADQTGQLLHSYSVDDTARPFGPEGRAWLAGVLRHLVENTRFAGAAGRDRRNS
jgi:beta-lactamase regulating signal transducer with metallopeptidase domain